MQRTLVVGILVLCFFQAVAEGLIPYRELDKYGWVNMKGEVEIRARFDKTFPHQEGMARFSHQGMFGFINATGRTAISNVYKEAFDFSEGLARVKEGPIWGFINKGGNKVFTVSAEEVNDFVGGRAIFKRRGFSGYLNKKGEEVFAPIFTHADNFNLGVARVQVGAYYGLIDRSGKLVLDLKFDYIGVPMDSFVRVKTSGLWFIYSLKGKRICKSPESVVSEVCDGLAVVRVLSKSQVIWRHFMTPQGEVVIDNNFEWAGMFKEGKAVVLYEGFYGVIDKQGQFIVEPTYQKTKGSYREGMLAVQKNENWGFLDGSGKSVINPTYFDVQNFENGYAMVSKGMRRWGMIDKTGKMLVPAEYDLVLEGSYYFVAILGYYKSYYTKTGELIWADKPDEE